MSKRQIKLGALTMGSGGPGRHNLWLDPELPADASVNIDWYIAIARQAEAALFDLMFIVDSQFITPGSGGQHPPYRPGGYPYHFLQRALQRRPPPGFAGPDQQGPCGVERGHQRRCRHCR